MRSGSVAVVLAGFALSACVSAPRPTSEAVRRLSNPPAVLEGRVRDPQGRPVSGVRVQALPREKHLTWSPPAVTDAQGRFRLTVVAPGEYGFVIERDGVGVVTTRPDDPARMAIRLRPGERRGDIELVLRTDEWEKALRAPATRSAPPSPR